MKGSRDGDAGEGGYSRDFAYTDVMTLSASFGEKIQDRWKLKRECKGGNASQMKRGIKRGELGEKERSKAGIALIPSRIKYDDPQIGEQCLSGPVLRERETTPAW